MGRTPHVMGSRAGRPCHCATVSIHGREARATEKAFDAEKCLHCLGKLNRC